MKERTLVLFLKNRFSIKSEVFYLGLLSSLLILLVFGILILSSLFNISIDKARQSIKEANHQISIFTEGYFADITNTIEALSKSTDIVMAMEDEAAKQRALKTYQDHHETNPAIAYIYSGYENGHLLINDYTPPEGFDPRERPWYVAAVNKNPEISIGLPYREALTDEWLLSQSKVLRDTRGHTVGVIAIDVSLEKVVNLLRERHLYSSQRSYVVDQQGTIIIHPEEEFVGDTISEIRDQITKEQGALSYSNNNTRMWGHYSTIASTDWVFVTDVERREVLGPVVSNIVLYIFSVTLLAAVLGMAQSKIFGKRFAEPLTELGKRISSISRGDSLQETTYEHSNHEIATIASNIEKLAERSLSKKANELKTIIESVEDGILVVNTDRKVVYLNSRFKEMWQMPDDVSAMEDDQVFIHAAAEQVKGPESFTERIEELYSCDQNSLDTLYFKDERVFERFSCPLLEAGQVAGRLWSFRDITERKRAEQKITDYTLELELKGIELEELYRQLDREMEKARHIHERTLPETLPLAPGVSLAAHYQPAQKLGGDFYDAFQVDNKLIIYLSDVSGHGLDGAMLSVFVKETIDSYVNLKPDQLAPPKMLQHLNRQFRRKNYPREYFVCIFLVVFDLETRELSYTGAGFQAFPTLRLDNQQQMSLDSEGPPVSAAFPPELMNFQENKVTLEPGSTILFSTDGLYEQYTDGQFYQSRAEHVFSEHCHLPPALIVPAINEDFRRFAGDTFQPDDDITFLVMQLDPPGINKLYLELESQPKELNRLYQEVLPFLEHLDHLQDAEFFFSALYELTVNGMEHGNRLDLLKKVFLEIIIAEEYILAAVQDQGEGFDWRAALEAPLELEGNQERGRGLAMSRLLCDQLCYNNRGNRAIVLKKI